MFSATLTDSKAFANTFEWAILSLLPMDDEVNNYPPVRATDVNVALGFDPKARTSMVQTLKNMAARGVIKRYEVATPGNKRPVIFYSRLLPLRKREMIARFIRG